MSTDARFEAAFNLLCGARIGSGMSRTVFECSLLPGFVVKVEDESSCWHQNALEYLTWETVKHTKASRWFAACRWISPNGLILIQEKTRPPLTSEFPDSLPIWFTDFKPDNYGVVRAREQGEKDWFVCHDYGTSLVLQEGTTTSRKKKVGWGEL